MPRVQRKKVVYQAVVLAGLTLWAGPITRTSAKDSGPVDPVMPTRWVFTMPKGDPAAGEKAFVKMQCFSCHKVTGKSFSESDTNAESIGPEFTPAYAKLPAGYLAESIINFDRFIPHANFKVSYLSLEAFKPAGRDDYDTHSRMANYNTIMTVQELIDIVAFLKSLDEKQVP